MFNSSCPEKDKERKLTQIIIFTLLCGASESFKMAFKRLYKTFSRHHKEVQEERQEGPRSSFRIVTKMFSLLILPKSKGHKKEFLTFSHL